MKKKNKKNKLRLSVFANISLVDAVASSVGIVLLLILISGIKMMSYNSPARLSEVLRTALQYEALPIIDCSIFKKDGSYDDVHEMLAKARKNHWPIIEVHEEHLRLAWVGQAITRDQFKAGSPVLKNYWKKYMSNAIQDGKRGIFLFYSYDMYYEVMEIPRSTYLFSNVNWYTMPLSEGIYETAEGVRISKSQPKNKDVANSSNSSSEENTTEANARSTNPGSSKNPPETVARGESKFSAERNRTAANNRTSRKTSTGAQTTAQNSNRSAVNSPLNPPGSNGFQPGTALDENKMRPNTRSKSQRSASDRSQLGPTAKDQSKRSGENTKNTTQKMGNRRNQPGVILDENLNAVNEKYEMYMKPPGSETSMNPPKNAINRNDLMDELDKSVPNRGKTPMMPGFEIEESESRRMKRTVNRKPARPSRSQDAANNYTYPGPIEKKEVEIEILVGGPVHYIAFITNSVKRVITMDKLGQFTFKMRFSKSLSREGRAITVRPGDRFELVDPSQRIDSYYSKNLYKFKWTSLKSGNSFEGFLYGRIVGHFFIFPESENEFMIERFKPEEPKKPTRYWLILTVLSGIALIIGMFIYILRKK